MSESIFRLRRKDHNEQKDIGKRLSEATDPGEQEELRKQFHVEEVSQNYKNLLLIAGSSEMTPILILDP